MHEERAPYGRRKKGQDVGFPPSQRERAGGNGQTGYQGETYYGRPAIKPSYYGWLIVAYFFIGGIASAAQFIATVVDLFGQPEDRFVVRTGRYLALLGSLISPVLLIADLHYPKRWYNMLRIYRSSSPMSIGAWALMLFGALSGLTAIGQAVEDLAGLRLGRWIARLGGIPAALAGGMVSLYTGTLLAATSVPLWAAAFPFLSSLFGASAASTATASLTLVAEASGAPPATRQRLERFGLVASLVELLFALIVDRRWRQRGVAGPIQQAPFATLWHLNVLGIGIVGPILVHAGQVFLRRESRLVSILAALSTLHGGFALRAVMIFAGNESAKRPEDYFQISEG